MNVNKLSKNKIEIVRNAFNNDKDKVTFCDSEFKISDPNFCSGTIDSNCSALISEDLNVIDCFDINKLNNIENDLEYLLQLVKARKKELKPIEEIFEINTNEFREGNKKFISVVVNKKTVQKDNNADEFELRFDELERFKYNNTKQFQAEIENKIAELKEKYSIV
jgi:CRISPR/Cas system CMR-associated protein Cmr1 (group 7 of RAMP superfamily)